MLFRSAEAAIHATRRLLSNLSDNYVFFKLDFTNAFNSVRRDTILTKVAEKMQELYRFICDSLDCNLQLIFGENIIISAEGSQQGDPLSGLKFCASIQLTLIERQSGSNNMWGFVDEIDLEGEVPRVVRDIQTIVDSRPQTGLLLNIHKCEITTRNFDIIDKFPIFQHFRRVPLEDMTLRHYSVLQI